MCAVNETKGMAHSLAFQLKVIQWVDHWEVGVENVGTSHNFPVTSLIMQSSPLLLQGSCRRFQVHTDNRRKPSSIVLHTRYAVGNK